MKTKEEILKMGKEELNTEHKECACGMSMKNYAWTKTCRLCSSGRRKLNKTK